VAANTAHVAWLEKEYARKQCARRRYWRYASHVANLLAKLGLS
jgi:hypothetical protein